jgi:hypothetical protein
MLTSCGCVCAPAQCKYHPQYDWGFSYSVEPNQTTPSGVLIDASGQYIDLNEIDRKISETENCLARNFPNGDLSGVEGWCSVLKFEPFIDRHCITVKIPSNWSWSCDGKEQLLADDAPQEGCGAKGFKEDPDCPCKWRAGIQDGGIIITTPNLRLFKDPLVKMITSCEYIYEDPKLAECVK